MNDEPVYTWGGMFGCFLLALAFYGFFFGIVWVFIEVGRLT